MTVRYTVKQVSRLTGISTDLLRAWERRYGVVTPSRTASRYRLYGDDDVSRLRRMAELVEQGAPASLAAQQVLTELPPTPEPSDTATSAADSVEGGGDGPTDGARVRSDGTSAWTPQLPPAGALPPVDTLAEAARDLDRAALERTLDGVMAAGSFEAVFDEWIAPALVRVGEAWAAEEVSVAGEHFVSAAVHRRLSQAFDAAGTAVNAPVVLVGLPPRTMHELAALAFATCLKRRGVDVRYLGANLPVQDWVSAVRRISPAAVAISVPRESDSPAALEIVLAVTEAHPSVRLFAGGTGCARWDGSQPVTVLEGSVTRSAHDLAVILAS